MMIRALFLPNNLNNEIVTFEELNLNKPLLSALSDLEYFYPTPIQKKAFSVIMSGKDVLGIAQTGTGKTFAYLLPILRLLPFSKQKDPRVLILAPTHELVNQIFEEIKKLTKYSNLRSLAIVGGANMGKQKQAIYDGTDIIVGTPGRLLDLAYTEILSLKSVQKLVIDEVDEMLSLGFKSQLSIILDKLPTRRQNLMFSATLNTDIENLIQDSFPLVEKIEIEPHGTPLENIIQVGYHVPNFHTKANLLSKLLNENKELSKVLVFVKTKKMADKLYDHLQSQFADNIGVIHSNKAHNTRMNAVKKFDEGIHRIIIATDVIARGMDLSDVSHVINFDLSDQPGDYIHRIGRTGRADKIGIAISFINEVEKEYQSEIEQLMDKKIPMEALPADLAISQIFAEDEKPKDKVLMKMPKTPKLVGGGAFHEKSDKNKKKEQASKKKNRRRVYSKSGKFLYKPD